MAKWLWCAAMGVAMVVALSGCEAPGTGEEEFEFKNESSYQVTVSPNGQSGWSQFILGAGQSRDVEIDDDTIHYIYSPSNKVWADNSGDGEITFRNR